MPLLQSVVHPSEQHPPPELIPQLHECLLNYTQNAFLLNPKSTSGAEDSWAYTFSKEKVKQLGQAQ